MLAKGVVALATLLLGGCAGLPDWGLFAPAAHQASSRNSGEFDFSWRLSGEPAVAPLQVFDNGRQMWLQFAPDQSVPAIFARTADGDRLLDYRREGPYVVLDRVWPQLILRGGTQSSMVERIASSSALLPKSETQSETRTEPMAVDTSVAIAQPEVAMNDQHEQARAAVVPDKEQVAPVASPSPLFAEVPEPAAHAIYAVSPQDLNMRLALARWAGLAGWTFEAEHWSVDADIPIAGSARFESGFKQAVQALMAATELADRPLQPCFYSNKVLRIVPYAQPCNRVASLSGNS